MGINNWTWIIHRTTVNNPGSIVADSINTLLENWRKVLFIDIYDWYEGVGNNGICLSKPVFKNIFQMVLENSKKKEKNNRNLAI